MDSNVTYIDGEVLNDELRTTLLPVTLWVGAEAVLGFTGNLIVLFVFFFRYHVCNFRYFVLCLALTDVIASCTAITGEVITQIFWYIYPFPTICKIKSFFNVFTVFAEAFCLLTIAVDRYRKVCQPLAWQITPKMALIVCFVIYAVSGVVAIPVAIFWGTHDKVINKTGLTIDGREITGNVLINVTVCEIDRAFVGRSQPQNYTYSLETIISLSLIPMFILYILVARTLIGSSKLKEKRLSTMANKNTGKARFNGYKSDTGYTTDEETSKASYPNGVIKKPLPTTPSDVKIKVIDTDISTANSTPNSMTTTRNGINTTETSFQDDSPSSQKDHVPTSKPRPTRRVKKAVSSRVRRKTLIMFILTLVFIVTTITYLTMLGLIAGDILDTLSNSGKAAYFFFFRFYFINHVINPFVYGVLDPQFRRVMGQVANRVKSCCV